MKKVLIIGGGFAGSRATRILERDKNLEVTLVDTKDYFEFTPSVAKIITNPKFSRKIQILHKDYLKKTKIIIGEVIELSKKEAIVKTNNSKDKISFDYCIICSGSSYSFPFKAQNIILSSRISSIENLCRKILNSKKIAIIGGGLVGVEIASEFLNDFKDKEIIIIHKNEDLIERMNKDSRDYAKKTLEERGAKIFFNENVIDFKETYVITDKGKKIEADLYFICTGIIPNFEFLKKNFSSIINEKNQIKVNDFLQVHGMHNIFSAGDVNSINEEKTAQNAEKQAQLITRNILNIENGKELEKYESKERVIIISLGRYNAMAVFKEKMLPGLFSAFLKKFIEVRHMEFIRLGINFHKI